MDMLRPYSQASDKDIAQFIKSRYGNSTKYGYFMIDQQNSRNSVVAFILFCTTTRDDILKSELQYILVDKNYQGNSFGTRLINQFLKEITKMGVVHASAQVDKEDILGWYHKFGFTVKSIGKYGKTFVHCFPNKDTNEDGTLKVLKNLAFEYKQRETNQEITMTDNGASSVRPTQNFQIEEKLGKEIMKKFKNS
jgi:GNAT superfamily N-acetyltransferase